MERGNMLSVLERGMRCPWNFSEKCAGSKKRIGSIHPENDQERAGEEKGAWRGPFSGPNVPAHVWSEINVDSSISGIDVDFLP